MAVTECGRSPDFALIGHQEDWRRIYRIVDHLRSPHKPPLDRQTIRDTVPWIPPRIIVDLRLTSPASLRGVDGVYVETFLTPDELAGGHGGLHRCVTKVEDAVAVASRAGARLATLGGFTSILLESRTSRVVPQGIALTTGNTLTAAFIVKAIEAVATTSVPLVEATVLVVGATGDIGSACTRYLARQARRILVTARNGERLEHFVRLLRKDGVDAAGSVDLSSLVGRADYVIAAASLSQPSIDLAGCQPHAVVCDAGYPKNLRQEFARGGPRIFWGGLGRVSVGWTTSSSLLDRFYSFPLARVAHGCMLEGMLLALAGRFESFSVGRGNITPDRIDELWRLAQEHGMTVAPFFNGEGLWPAA